MAKAKIMRDADLLKLLRSVRPLNDDGSLKTHVDLHRCIRVWLTLTEAGVLSEHLSRMLLLRLCECGKAGVALGMALAEPWLLWRYNGSVQLAFAMEELWKHLWKRGQLNKSSDLKVVPILQGRASGLADLSAQLQAQRRELLLKGPLEALHLAQRILEQEQVGTAMEPGAPDAEAARVATVLCVIPSPALVVLARQGLFTILLRRCSAAPAPLAAALQVCALGVSLSLAWSPKSVEGSAQPESSEQDSLGKCLTAAADQLERISYPKVPRIQEQADMKEI
ncbi:HERC2, partial [Symbiodinium pilosum]